MCPLVKILKNLPVVWVGFSVLVTFFSGVWIIERSKGIHGNMINSIKEYYASIGDQEPDQLYLRNIEAQADSKNMIGIITLIIIVSITLFFLFLTLYFIKENEKKHKQQLDSVSTIVNKDDLTGVNNHRAFIATERRIISASQDDQNYQYGIAVCDINDLKYVNDRFGHDYGDEYIRNACKKISDIFKHSPVFRIGGDEFVAVLEGEDFNNREALIKELKDYSLANTNTDSEIVIAVGMAIKTGNETFNEVFRRADKLMYTNKGQLKKKRPSHNLR